MNRRKTRIGKPSTTSNISAKIGKSEKKNSLEMTHQLFNSNIKASSSNNQTWRTSTDVTNRLSTSTAWNASFSSSYSSPPRSVPAKKHSEQHPPAGTHNKVAEMQLPRRNTTVTKAACDTQRQEANRTTEDDPQQQQQQRRQKQRAGPPGWKGLRRNQERPPHTHTPSVLQANDKPEQESSLCASLGLTHAHAPTYTHSHRHT